jgi:hypothetical protein
MSIILNETRIDLCSAECFLRSAMKLHEQWQKKHFEIVINTKDRNLEMVKSG